MNLVAEIGTSSGPNSFLAGRRLSYNVLLSRANTRPPSPCLLRPRAESVSCAALHFQAVRAHLFSTRHQTPLDIHEVLHTVKQWYTTGKDSPLLCTYCGTSL